MFNNFTGENQYQSCNIIVAQKDERGSLLLGDFNSASEETILKKHKILTIITAAAGLQHLEIPSTVTRIVYPLKDSKTENISVYFDECYKTIQRKLEIGGVLVHCSAGVSRSATLVIAYLMRKNQISFKSAIKYVRSRRSGICPNLGFELQLKEYQKTILGDISLPITKKKIEKRRESNHNFSQQSPFQSQKKQIQNHSMFSFDITGLKNENSKKLQGKKISKKLYNLKSKPRSSFDLDESDLFIVGKSTKQSFSHRKDDKKLPKMIQTWRIVKT